MESVELKVEMYGIHSENRIRKCLSKLRGVKTVEVELRRKKVIIRGDADEKRIVKALRRIGFRSETWSSKAEMLLSAYNGGRYKKLWIADSLIVAVAPSQPPKHLRDPFDDDDDDDDDELKCQVPDSSNWLTRKLFFLLKEKMKVPDVILVALFCISLKMRAIIIMWFILAPIAYKWDIGPLYIIGTDFCIILFNLGQRQHGDLSAYSIFNDDFRELPGTLNADRLDQDIRAGQF